MSRRTYDIQDNVANQVRSNDGRCNLVNHGWSSGATHTGDPASRMLKAGNLNNGSKTKRSVSLEESFTLWRFAPRPNSLVRPDSEYDLRPVSCSVPAGE